MAEKIKRCVVIGASPYSHPEFIKKSVRDDDFILCADGGMDIAFKAGITPAVIIGDFDSLKAQRLLYGEKYTKIVLPTEKDDTDTIACIRYGISHGYREFILLGATGGRIDHTYANLHLLKFLYQNGCYGMIKDKFTDICYTETEMILREKGKTVSVLPFGCENAEVSLQGFKYKAENLVMTSDFPIGISNIAEQEVSTVKVHTGGVLVIVNNG